MAEFGGRGGKKRGLELGYAFSPVPRKLESIAFMS